MPDTAETLPGTDARSIITGEEVRAVVAAGLAAPSGDNCQPWEVALRADGFELWFDPGRAASVFDVNDVASRLATGAFLENVRLRATELGLAVSVTVAPDPSTPRRWARVVLARQAGTVPDELAAAITQRHCQRGPFAADPLAPDLVRGLAAASAGRAAIRVLAARAGLAELARLVETGERARAAWREAHLALYKWLRFSRREALGTRDGLDVRTLGVSAGQRAAMRALRPWPVMRAGLLFGAGRAMGAYARRVVERSGAVCLVTSRDLGPAGLLEAGRVLQRAWLGATARGLQGSVLGALTLFVLRLERGAAQGMPARHVPRLQAAGARLRQLYALDTGEHPLLLLRVGHAPPPAVVSLRRPVPDVLRPSPSESHER